MDRQVESADDASPKAAFHAVLPSTFDDSIVGPVLRRLAEEDPDVIAAVAEVDRSLIWAALAEPPLERMHRAASMGRTLASMRDALR